MVDATLPWCGGNACTEKNIISEIKFQLSSEHFKPVTQSSTHNLQNYPKLKLSDTFQYVLMLLYPKFGPVKKKHTKHAIRFGKNLSHKTIFSTHSSTRKKKQSLKYKYVASKKVGLDEHGHNIVFQHSRASLLFILFLNTLLAAQRLCMTIINWLSLPP